MAVNIAELHPSPRLVTSKQEGRAYVGFKLHLPVNYSLSLFPALSPLEGRSSVESLQPGAVLTNPTLKVNT
jgi:hypothetical protein